MGRKKKNQKGWDYKPGKYYVKGIIDYRNINGLEEYLVWWEGYGEDEATWEPTKNISTASKEAWWQESLRQCRDKALKKEEPCKNKTKSIRHGADKDKKRVKCEKDEKRLDKALYKLADYLLRNKDSLNQIGEASGSGSIELEEMPDINQKSIVENQCPNGPVSLQELSFSIEPTLQKIESFEGSPSKNSNFLMYEKQNQPWSLQNLPVQGLKKRFRYRDKQYYYQIDMNKNQQLYPILLHQDYIKKYWNDHLQRFNSTLPSQHTE